jgi:hypothetical protein
VSTVRELGVVTADDAAGGVQATAKIVASGSVGFQFSLAVGGDYILLFRHTGGDVVLLADTPGGAATIHPGPAGPFQAFALPLPMGDYLITATADGGRAAFIDWELVLANGVGQAPAALVGYELSNDAGVSQVPVAPSSPTLSLSMATGAGPTSISTSSAVGPAAVGGLTLVPVSGLIGRPTNAPGESVPSDLEPSSTEIVAAYAPLFTRDSLKAEPAAPPAPATAAGDDLIALAGVDTAGWLGALLERVTPVLDFVNDPTASSASERPEMGAVAASDFQAPAATTLPDSAPARANLPVWPLPFAGLAIMYHRARKRARAKDEGSSTSSAVPAWPTSRPEAMPRWMRESMIPKGAVKVSSLLPRWPRSQRSRFSRLAAVRKTANTGLVQTTEPE